MMTEAPKKNKVHIISLGCPKNLVDSDRMLNTLSNEGFRYEDSAQNADAIIINTCGFIESAKQESIDEILMASELKQQYPDKKVLAVGCLTERYLEDLKKEFQDEVDGFLGVDPDKNITTALHDLGLQGEPDGCMNISSLGKSHSAYLKISEGCSNSCSFCAIPLMKGLFKHRTKEDIFADLKRSVDGGAKEISIIAQDTTFYGRGLYRDYRLHNLYEDIAAYPGVEWLRLLYAYPSHLSDEVIEAIGTLPQSCRYIDMPMQHVSNKMLELMGRRMTYEQIMDKVEKLRKYDIAIRSTFIVGFPGEGPQEFKELLQFIEDVQLERMGVFPYSLEEGTKSYDLGDPISAEVKKERIEQAMALQQKISLKNNQAYVGKTIPVILDGAHQLDPNFMMARSKHDAPDIDGVVYVDKQEGMQTGQIIDVQIIEAFEYDLRGRATE